MGHDPVSPSYFREYLRVVRGLLQGEEIEYKLNGQTKPIRFLDRELGCLDIEHPVPIYVAANGPRALKAAGAFGDGRIGAGNEPVSVLQHNLERIENGANEVKRKIHEDFHTAAMTFSCVLGSNEKLSADRVIDEVGAQVVASLHFWYEIYRQRGSDQFVLEGVRGVWEDYKQYVETEMPLNRRHQLLHQGHCALLPAPERRFVTAEMIKVTGGLVGEPDEIVSGIKELEAGGLKEIILLPPCEVMRSNFRDFSERIMSIY